MEAAEANCAESGAPNRLHAYSRLACGPIEPRLSIASRRRTAEGRLWISQNRLVGKGSGEARKKLPMLALISACSENAVTQVIAW